MNTSIHSRGSLENHAQFKTKLGKCCTQKQKYGPCYTRFKTKTAESRNPLGRHILHGLCKGVPPPPGFKCPMVMFNWRCTSLTLSMKVIYQFHRYSLVPRPVCAIRVTRGGLEPSAIARGLAKNGKKSPR